MVVRTFKGPPESERVCLFLQHREEKKEYFFWKGGGVESEKGGVSFCSALWCVAQLY